MTSSSDPISTVSQRLERFAADRHAEVAGLGDEAVGFVASALAAIHGGKRLRARFLDAGYRAVGGSVDGADAADVAGVAGALEIFQAAALVHDDLVDNSDTRRGRPAAHRALENQHRGASWLGDAELFGRAAAVLLGDLLVAWSDDLLEESIADHPRAADVRRQYAMMRRDVTIGQYLDVAEEAAYASAPENAHAGRALRIASYKSARYSVQQPLLIGAALGGGSAAQRDALGRFGHTVGLAFQLRDDVLGVFGDAAVTGKPSGDDLREGKRTVLVAYARETLDESDRAELDAGLGDRGLTDEQISRLQHLVASSGAVDRIEDDITRLTAEAHAALTGAPISAGAVTTLMTLGEAAMQRSA
ncbi:polyprenyl synthetase family protein [Microbacterium oleivorans]|uniref:Polyprenyl synthetase family protein n=1 Tax=Microbacterium oleivorans TaxID=273677 RepID=A0A7D5EWQ7_9MICO|nr:polyprenyl synthetase family protein [Microbacterium oleivorans]QLD12852.1 polyprenyl synthetase family protein [Microbacterium oleivorans]